jgi:hypothetical protein
MVDPLELTQAFPRLAGIVRLILLYSAHMWTSRDTRR